MNAPWPQPVVAQEELDYWERRREARLAAHPIDYDALEAACDEDGDADEEGDDDDEA